MLTDDFRINHRFPLEIKKSLIKRGAPMSAFSPTNFDIDSYVVRITSDIQGLNTRTISIDRQLSKLSNINSNPLSNYILIISSYPSDNLAKYLALSLMYKGYYVHSERKRTQRYARKVQIPPLWHRVYNSFKNVLVEERQNPCMLVMSNVVNDSTQLKFEKLRDLLDMYEDIPRIIVTSGFIDPVSFSAKLNITSTANIYLGPQDRIRSL